MNNCSYNINMNGGSYMSQIPDNKVIDKMENLLNVASDFTRLKILYCIQYESKTVSQIVSECQASQSLISHQLSILRKARLVSTEKRGKNFFYMLNDEHIDSLLSIVFEHVMEDKKLKRTLSLTESFTSKVQGLFSLLFSVS